MSKYIDKIFYINLDYRENRKQYIETQLLKLDVPFERFSAIQQNKNGLGCTRSHLEIYKIAKERGYKSILILEDDFSFEISKYKFENQINQLFKNGPSFDVCFISNTMVILDEPIPNCDFLNRCLDVYGAEGYIVKSHYYDTLIELYEESVKKLEETGMHWLYTVDRAWIPLLKKDKWFRFIHRFGRQNNEFISDNK